MISKTKIAKRTERKTDSAIVETIVAAKKNEGWRKVAQIVSGSKRDYLSVNLKEIETQTKEGDTIVIPGKVLSSGELTKKIRVCAISFSEAAKEKLKKAKSEAVILIEEIKKNPKAEGIKLIK